MKKGTIIQIVAALSILAATVISARPKLRSGLGVVVQAKSMAEADPQKTTGPPATAPDSNSKVYADAYTKKLLLLMDTDKNGKVSKKEFLDFMAKEFDRLDTNHDGELDVHELAKFHEPPAVGK